MRPIYAFLIALSCASHGFAAERAPATQPARPATGAASPTTTRPAQGDARKWRENYADFNAMVKAGEYGPVPKDQRISWEAIFVSADGDRLTFDFPPLESPVKDASVSVNLEAARDDKEKWASLAKGTKVRLSGYWNGSVFVLRTDIHLNGVGSFRDSAHGTFTIEDVRLEQVVSKPATQPAAAPAH